MLQATIDALQATVDASATADAVARPPSPVAASGESTPPSDIPTADGDMVFVPAGEFIMGPDAQDSVYLDAFWIDKTEVTAAQYRGCVAAGACSAPDTSSPWCTYGDASKLDYPINCVDWNQAAVFCGWVGRRLPTDAEWEKAARGTDGRTYPWGEQEPTGELLNFFLDGSGISSFGAAVDDGNELIAPAVSYPGGASPYGALNMAGNVAEWVADGSFESRVLRGGSFSDGADDVRAAYRDAWSPDDFDDDWGFRCARSP